MVTKEVYYGLACAGIWFALCGLVIVLIDDSAVAPWVMFIGYLASRAMDGIRKYFLR